MVEDAAITLKEMTITTLENINTRLFLWINAGAGMHPSLDYVAIFFAEGGAYLLMALFIFSWFVVDERRRTTLLLAAEASIVGLLFNFIITLVYFHPRPFMMGIGHTLLPHGPETSFPSDHASLLFSASIYLLIFSRWVSMGGVLLFVAILTAWGRVYCGLHFPFDMLGSLVVAVFACLILYRLRASLEPINRGVIRVL